MNLCQPSNTLTHNTASNFPPYDHSLQPLGQIDPSLISLPSGAHAANLSDMNLFRPPNLVFHLASTVAVQTSNAPIHDTASSFMPYDHSLPPLGPIDLSLISLPSGHTDVPNHTTPSAEGSITAGPAPVGFTLTLSIFFWLPDFVAP